MKNRKQRTTRLVRATNVEGLAKLPIDASEVSFTPKLLELIDLFVGGLSASSASRAIALIGPYGSGKSTSLLTLSRLCSDFGSPRGRGLWSELATAAPAIAKRLQGALRKSGKLVVLSLNVSELPLDEALKRKLQEVDPLYGTRKRRPRELRRASARDCIAHFLKSANLLLIIDELGRVLERASVTGSSTELQLLQDLAELSQQTERHSFHLITAQHFSNSNYDGSGGKSLLRELAKVQGRFREFPFVDAGDSSMELLAKEVTALTGEHKIERFNSSVDYRNLLSLSKSQETLVQQCRPLDPIAVLSLIELSRRYAQSTRTLMTFIKGDESSSLRNLIDFDASGDQLRMIHAYEVFDFFATSQVTAITASDFDLRWREISTLIRDHAKLPEDLMIVLKTIAVLNLASNAHLSASPELVEAALPKASRKHFRSSVSRLIDVGLVSWRESGNEYRAWRGTIFPIERELETTKGKLSTISTSSLLRKAMSQKLIFARKNGIETGIDRFFLQTWADDKGFHFEDILNFKPTPDGLIAYRLNTDQDLNKSDLSGSEIPIIEVSLQETLALRTAVVELTALNLIMNDIPEVDQVARTEIRERIIAVTANIDCQIAPLVEFGLSTATLSYRTNRIQLREIQSLSAAVTSAVEHVFPATPVVRNEMVSGRQLSSQGAKAVRLLIEAMYREPDSPRFGITGNPPEGAIYDSVFALTGLGRSTSSVRRDREVAKTWEPLMSELKQFIALQTAVRTNFSRLVDIATSPPFGLRRPLANLILSSLVRTMRSDITLYEHGTIVIDFNDAVAERLFKNPDLFSFRASSVNLRANRGIVDIYRQVLGLTRRGVTAVDIAALMISKALSLPPFALNTLSSVDERTVRFRKALRGATDPETLLFEELPAVLIDEKRARIDADTKLLEFKKRLVDVLDELNSCYSQLLATFDRWILTELKLGDSADHPSKLSKGIALAVRGYLMHPQQRALVDALLRDDLSPTEWTENLAMVVSQAGSPRNWNDDQVVTFRTLLQEQMTGFRRLLSLSIQSGNQDTRQHRFALVSLISTDGSSFEQILHMTTADDALIAMARSSLIGEIEKLGLSDSAIKVLLLSLLFENPQNSDQGIVVSISERGPTTSEALAETKDG